MFVNSVCGCAAGSARPGLAMSLSHEVVPDVVATVFAGVDLEATARLRGYFKQFPASSPQVALFQGGRFVHLMQRHQIEGRHPEEVASALVELYDHHFKSEE